MFTGDKKVEIHIETHQETEEPVIAQSFNC